MGWLWGRIDAFQNPLLRRELGKGWGESFLFCCYIFLMFTYKLLQK